MKLLLENWRRFLKEEEQEYEIYCDMDGVLVDFELGTVGYITSDLKSGKAAKLAEEIGRDYIDKDDIKSNKAVRNYMYKKLQHNADFWESLPWLPNGQKLWATIAPHDPNILTTPMGYGSEIGKQAWIDNNLNPLPKKVFMSRDKYLWANKNSILIDDWIKNIIPWEEHDGIALVYKDQEIEKTLLELRELGL